MFKRRDRRTASARKTAKIGGEKGFTLIEIMVAMVIFLIVTASVYGLLQVGRIDRSRASRRSDVLKNARVAVHLIGRDALNAGLGFHRRGAFVPDDFISTRLGVVPDTNDERDVLTSIIVGNDVFPNNLSNDANARTDTIAFAFRDVDFNGGNVINLQNVDTPVGQPSVARLQTSAANGAATVSRNDLLLIESDSTQVAVMAGDIENGNRINVAPNDALNLNQKMDESNQERSLLWKCTSDTEENCTTYVATLKRFFWVSYRVKEDGTLIRIVYGNNGNDAVQIQEQPLAYNVEDFQIRYVLENGVMTDDPTAGVDGAPGTNDDNPFGANSIRQIIVSIRVQSTEIDEQLRVPTTVTLNATFSPRNLEYDAG